MNTQLSRQQLLENELLDLSQKYLKKVRNLAKLQFLHHSKAQQFQGTVAQFRKYWTKTSAYPKEARLRLQVKGIEKRMSVLKLVLFQNKQLHYDQQK